MSILQGGDKEAKIVAMGCVGFTCGPLIIICFSIHGLGLLLNIERPNNKGPFIYDSIPIWATTVVPFLFFLFSFWNGNLGN